MPAGLETSLLQPLGTDHPDLRRCRRMQPPLPGFSPLAFAFAFALPGRHRGDRRKPGRPARFPTRCSRSGLYVDRPYIRAPGGEPGVREPSQTNSSSIHSSNNSRTQCSPHWVLTSQPKPPMQPCQINCVVLPSQAKGKGKGKGAQVRAEAPGYREVRSRRSAAALSRARSTSRSTSSA